MIHSPANRLTLARHNSRQGCDPPFIGDGTGTCTEVREVVFGGRRPLFCKSGTARQNRFNIGDCAATRLCIQAVSFVWSLHTTQIPIGFGGPALSGHLEDGIPKRREAASPRGGLFVSSARFSLIA